MEIVKVDESFAEIIGQVHATAWQQAYKNMFSDDYILQDSFDKRRAECIDALRMNKAQYYLLTDETVAVGIVKVSLNPKGICEIESIYLLEEFQHRGYGTAAIDYIKSQFPDRAIILWVLQENHSAIQFYKKNHFVFTGETRTIFRGKDYTQLCAVCKN
jgi:ribosomal protein S18 acetylase RimI-like enzyme